MYTTRFLCLILFIFYNSLYSQAQIVVNIDKSIKYQKIDGFGAMAENLPGWGNFQDMSPDYINTFVDDLGCTIFRTAIDGTMESTNDNDDPNVFDISKFNMGKAQGGCLGDYHIPLNYQIKNLNALKAKIDSNGDKALFFSTVFSPPHWMKYNKCIFGTDGVWNRLVNSDDEIEKNGTDEVIKDRKDEFAEFCLGYVTIMKNAGIDIMAMNIQNEPAFPQSFSSCVYTAKSYAATVGVVGDKLRKNNFNTKMIFTEDISDLSRYGLFIRAMLNNPSTANYLDIAAIHSYAANAITPESSDATTWRSLDNLSRSKNPERPFWQTETSGYPDTYEGGMSMAKAIFTALKYGKVNAWVFLGMTRPVRENNSEHESLVKVDGTKSDRYYAAKHFYRYIRPGAVQVESSQLDNGIMSIAFQNDASKELTIVLINPSTTQSKVIKLETVQKTGVPENFQTYLTTSDASQKVKSNGLVNLGTNITLEPNSVMTLVGSNSQPVLTTSSMDADMGASNDQVTIYPNPARDGFYFQRNITSNASSEIEIMNGQGIVVKSISIKNDVKEIYINTSDLPNGVYALKFNNGYKKVVVSN